MSVLENLKSARELLDTVGWTQNEFRKTEFNKGGLASPAAFCSLGAVRQAAGYYDASGRAMDNEISWLGELAPMEEAAQVLAAQLPKGFAARAREDDYSDTPVDLVIYFNDRVAESKDDVLELFDKAIEQEEKK